MQHNIVTLALAFGTQSMPALTPAQINDFWRDGYICVPDAVSRDELDAMRGLIAEWVEESRAHASPFGPETIDGRPRFDMGLEHSAEKPALRRINNPSDLYATYEQVMRDARVVDMVSDLIGPNVKFHHDKINLKLPGSNTEVHYHQDFLFTPHTNDDVVTALIMLDDVTEQNGCLKVVAGSHKGELHTLFEDGVFVGRMQEDVSAEMKQADMPVTGAAGSVCLMHTRLAHGSDANHGDIARGLYICVYTASDAFPLAKNPMPNPNEGSMVRGERSRIARMNVEAVELPEQPKSASFFTVQGQASKTTAE
jgi:ectoine hydroxylase-related dioxygenase (phytanoyl-CoA dioxygenase family)